MAKTIDSLLSIMGKYVGVSGRPNQFTRWYAGRHGLDYLSAAWCDMFVSYCAHEAGAGDIVGEEAYTPTHLNWFKAQGRAGTTPKRGAIVFFNWDGGRGGQPQHVGIVKSLNQGYLVTVEGNTGDAVKVRTRDPRYVVGYGYPAYAAEKPSKGPKYPGRIIYPGNSGDAVRTLKARLKAVGYSKVKLGPNYGPHAVAAVRDFQEKHKLEVDGRVGPATWKELFK